MPLVENLRALGQHALRKSRNVAAAFIEIGGLFRFEKVRVRRRDHANPRKNFTKELQNFRNFGAPRAQNLFISASMRCANRMTSLKFLAGSMVRSDPQKQARGIEITQNFFRNFGTPWAEKMRVFGQRSLRKIS